MAFRLADLFAEISLRGIAQSSSQLAHFRSQMMATDSAASGMSATLSSAFAFGAGGLIASGVSRAIGGLADAMQRVTSSAVGGSAQFEMYEQSMAVLLGSSTLAKEKIAELYDFAAKTPFQFPQLVSASQQLLAYGFAVHEIMPMMKAVGDAAAASPQGMEQGVERIVRAMGQIRAKGRAMAQEMLQLTEAGIPAWDMLAKKIGKTVPETMEIVQDRAYDARTAIEALIEGMNSKFGGMMEKQAKTLSGMWSTAKDEIASVTRQIGDGMLPTLKEWIGMLTRGAQEAKNFFNSGEIDAYFLTWTRGIRDFGSAFIDVFVGMGTAVATLASELSSIVDVLGVLQAMQVHGRLLVGEGFEQAAGRKASEVADLEQKLAKGNLSLSEQRRTLDQIIMLEKQRVELLKRARETTPESSDPATAARVAAANRATMERSMKRITEFQAQRDAAQSKIGALPPPEKVRGLFDKLFPRAVPGEDDGKPTAKEKKKAKDGILGLFDAAPLPKQLGALWGDLSKAWGDKLAMDKLNEAPFKSQTLGSSDFFTKLQEAALSRDKDDKMLKLQADQVRQQEQMKGKLDGIWQTLKSGQIKFFGG